MPNNNSLTTARDLGVLGAPIAPITDSVGTSDRDDFYRFTVTRNANVFFSLTGLGTSPAQLRIVTDLNGDGLVQSDEVVALDNVNDGSSSTADRSITTSLSPGVYWANVYTSSSNHNTAYTFNARAEERGNDNPVDPGQTLATALNLGSLAAPRTFQDVVGTVDRKDFYKFALLKNSEVRLLLSGLGNDPAQVRIVSDLNRDGIIQSSEIVAVDSVNDGSSSTADRSIITTLPAGGYWAEVFTTKSEQNTAYALELRATPQPNTPTFTGSISWDTQSGDVFAFRINGQTNRATVVPLGRSITDVNWRLQTTGDFNGDGQDDVLLRNFVSGQNLLWIMAPLGESIASEKLVGRDVPDPNWSLSGTGDFNGDGQADILLRNEAADQIVAWYMNPDGTIRSESLVGRSFGDNNWKIEAIADFNGDGKSDIVLRNAAAAQTILWTMNGSSIVSEGFIGRSVGPEWQIEGARDFNGDGIADLFWRNPTSGQGLLWTMLNSTTISQEQVIAGVPGSGSQLVF